MIPGVEDGYVLVVIIYGFTFIITATYLLPLSLI